MLVNLPGDFAIVLRSSSSLDGAARMQCFAVDDEEAHRGNRTATSRVAPPESADRWRNLRRRPYLSAPDAGVGSARGRVGRRRRRPRLALRLRGLEAPDRLQQLANALARRGADGVERNPAP